MDRSQSPAVGHLLTNSESLASLSSSNHLSAHVADSDSWSMSSTSDLQMVHIAEVKDVQSSEDPDASSIMFYQTGSEQPPNRSAPAAAVLPPNGQNGSFLRSSNVVTTSSGDSVTTASKERTVEEDELSRGVSQVPFSTTVASLDSGLPDDSASTPSSYDPGVTVNQNGSYLSCSNESLLDEMEPYLMSSVVTLMVRIPAYIAPGQKGRGKILKCTFSPHANVYQVRLTITETIQNETLMALSHLRLCRQLPDGSWQWLDEQRCLGVHGILTEAQLEMKELEAHFRDVIINIPQLGNQVNLEYDQFSLVQDILDAVLRIHDEQLNASSHSYALYHVRHKTRLSLTESMVFYEILSTDKLELKMVQGRAKMVVLTVEIPEAKSQRKIRASLDQTVGDLMSTLIRRLTDISERAWQYFSLYLRARTGRRSKGMWMEEYKFLSTYNLDEQDILEYRPKYRLFSFQLRIYPPCPADSMFGSDEDSLLSAAAAVGGGGLPVASSKPAFDPHYPRLLVDETTTNKQVVELLSNACCFEYPPSWYGLFDQNGTELARDKQIWDLVPRTGAEQQDTNFCIHMRYHSIKVSQDGEPDSEMQLSVDLSWPVSHLRDLLCRRYGIREPHSCGVQYRNSYLQPNICMLKQDVTEGTNVVLVYLSSDDPWVNSPSSGPSVDESLDEYDPGSSVDTTVESTYLQHVFPAPVKSKQPQQKRQLHITASDDCHFWDEPPDSEQNIRLGKNEVVIAGTFNKLVERLTHSDKSDMNFVHTFMATYQNFTKPEKLFSKLLERYSAVRQESMTFKEFNAFRTNIQVRTINAIRLWLDTAGDDFVNNDHLLQSILDYTDDVVMVDWPKFAGALRGRINEIRKGQAKRNRKATALGPPPRPILPSNVGTKVSLFAFEPEEIARQMCLIDFKIYSAILPHEFLNQCWAKPKYKDRAANLLRMIDRMNTVTYWVATTILSQKDKYGRAKRITTFVQIAEQLHKMRNYLTMMSVLSGLQHSSIMRLRKTYDKVDKKHMKVHNELSDLITPGNNFKDLRTLQDDAVPPSMPYIGIFMADLTFIDHGNDNLLSGGLINFAKCQLIYDRIRRILAAQATSYNFEVIPSLEESLTKMHVLKPEILGEMSMQREPR